MASSSMLRTKDVDTVIRQNEAGAAEGKRPQLVKRLGVADLIGFGVGIVIGTGIFTLTGVEAKDHAGPAIVLSFAIAGVIAMMAAVCYAELAAAVPTAGSSYTYAYVTIGEFFAWIIAWDLILEFALGAAVVSRGWSGYLQESFGLPMAWFGEEGSIVNIGAVAIVVVLGVVAALGIREAKWVTNLLVVLKLSICAFVIIAGIFAVKAANLSPWIPPSQPSPVSDPWHAQPLWEFLLGTVADVTPSTYGIAGVIMAAAVVFFAYSGFEAVANLGEETKRPAKDMPRGLIGTLLVCTILYLLVCFALTGMVKYTNLSEGAPISDAFSKVGMGWASVPVGIAAVAGLTSVILVELVTMGRIVYALCRDGLLPPALGKVHPKFRTPLLATIAIVVLVAALAAFVPLSALAEMVSIGTLFAFLVVAIAVTVLRRTKPKMQRPFKTPQVPLLPVLTAVLCVGLMAALEVGTWLRFLVWFGVGLVIYFGYGRKHSMLAPGNERKRNELDGGLQDETAEA